MNAIFSTEAVVVGAGAVGLAVALANGGSSHNTPNSNNATVAPGNGNPTVGPPH